MLSRHRLLLSAAVLALSAVAARAQQEPPPADTTPSPTQSTDSPPPTSPDAGDNSGERPRFLIGPELGVFFPSSARTRDAFGSHFTNIGVGLGAVQQRSERGALAFDLSFVTNRNKESNLTIVPVGLTYARRLGGGATSFRPFVGASANAFVVNMKTTKGDYDVKAGLRSGLGGSIFLGAVLGKSAYVQARYLAATEVSGFDLSGLNLSTGIRF
jgi:hypothetical protein